LHVIPKFFDANNTLDDGKSVVRSVSRALRSGRSPMPSSGHSHHKRSPSPRPRNKLPLAMVLQPDALVVATQNFPTPLPPPPPPRPITNVTPSVYSLGYSKLAEGFFYSLLDRYEITGLIDVRVAPSSKKPEYSMKHLAAACRSRRLGYWWVGRELGGKWKREVQDKLLSTEGQKVVENIHAMCVAGKRRWALLCLEKCWQDCAPRSLLGRALAQLGVSVVHISMASEPEIEVGSQPVAALEESGHAVAETLSTAETSQQVAETGTGPEDAALADESCALELGRSGCNRWKNWRSRRSQQLAASSTEVADLAALRQPAATTFSKLSRLVEWRRGGLLDEAEFIAFKAKLLEECNNEGLACDSQP